MLLNLAMASLICALMAGVFGFERTPSSTSAELSWVRSLFFPLLGIAAAAFWEGTLGFGLTKTQRDFAPTDNEHDRHAESATSPQPGTDL